MEAIQTGARVLGQSWLALFNHSLWPSGGLLLSWAALPQTTLYHWGVGGIVFVFFVFFSDKFGKCGMFSGSCSPELLSLTHGSSQQGWV